MSTSNGTFPDCPTTGPCHVPHFTNPAALCTSLTALSLFAHLCPVLIHLARLSKGSESSLASPGGPGIQQGLCRVHLTIPTVSITPAQTHKAYLPHPLFKTKQKDKLSSSFWPLSQLHFCKQFPLVFHVLLPHTRSRQREQINTESNSIMKF